MSKHHTAKEKRKIGSLRKKLLETTKVCYLTGRIVGTNASLDHVIPLSKGGKTDLENCKIACYAANQAKKDLSLEEFLKLCVDVLTYHGYV